MYSLIQQIFTEILNMLGLRDKVVVFDLMERPMFTSWLCHFLALWVLSKSLTKVGGLKFNSVIANMRELDHGHSYSKMILP